MRFTLSTKPLADSLDLGVVNANVSKYYQKSCIAQLEATQNALRINLEASNIVTEIRLKGSGDAADSGVMFVDSLLLKQLVKTFEASTTTLEFTDGGLILHSGKSKFTLPRTVDADSGMELRAPQLPESSAKAIDVNKSAWKFIKENQMYAIAMSFIHPIYTKVYIGEAGDVIVGDFDNSLFTLSDKGNFGATCLVSDTIVNLFNTLPEGSKLIKMGRNYLVRVETDSFEYVSEFTPQYEDEENVGSYNAEIILGMMEHPTGYAEVATAAVNKFLSQADLLSTSTDDTIRLGLEAGHLFIKDKNVDCKIDVKCDNSVEYFTDFKTSLLKSVMSNYSTEKVCIAPLMQEDVCAGIIVWSDELTTVIAGVD